MRNKPTIASSPFALIIIVFLTLILPNIYFRNTLDPVLMPRLLFLNLFLAAAYLFLILSNSQAFQNVSVLRRAVFALLFGYFFITLASGFWAYNFREGIFDMVKTFSVFSLVVLLALVFNQTVNWHEKLVKSVIIAALLASFTGFSQYVLNVILATDPWLPDGSPVIYSVKGLMAHRNQFSMSLMLMLPFTGFGIYYLKNKWKWVASVSSALLLVLIFLLQTRSVWIGISVSAITVVFSIIFFGKKLPFGKGFIIKSSVVALVIGFFSIYWINNYSPVNNTVTGSKKPGLLDPFSAKNYNRFKIYNVSTEMILEHPLTGVGAGNWKIHSPRYFKKYHFDRDQLNWIRPHSDYLWVTAEKGIAGLLIFLGIFAITFFYLYKILISNAEVHFKIFALFLFGGITAYMVISLFSFPLERINQQVYLSLLIASVVVIYHNIFPDKPKSLESRRILPFALPLLVFGVIYGISAVNMEILVKKARNLQMKSNWPGLLSESKKIPQTFKNIDVEGMPIPWYSGLAATNMRDFEAAQKEYGKAAEIFPTNVKVLNNLGQAYIESGNYEKGLKSCQQAVSILPYYPEALVNMSWAYFNLNRFEESMEMLLKIREHDRTNMIKQLMSKIMVQDSFLTNKHYDFRKYTYSGSIITKYQRTIENLPDWKEDVLRKAELKNIPSWKAVLDDACYVAQQNDPGKFFTWYGNEYYKTRIRNDSAWMKLIQEKSRKNNITVDEQLKLDANYLFLNEKPEFFEKHAAVENEKQKLLNESNIKDFIADKAKKLNMPFEEMLDVYAGYLFELQLNTLDPLEKRLTEIVDMIENNNDWYRQVVMKSRAMKKPVEETLWKEAYYFLIQDQQTFSE